MKNIKYEQLSQDIKKEIDAHYKKINEKQEKIDIKDTMRIWFDEKFDDWVNKKYCKDVNSNKRKHFRLNIEIPVRIVETLIESSDENNGEELIGTMVNISKGGLYFKSEKSFEISSIIMVKIDLTKIDKDLNNIEALAMIVRSEKIEVDKYGIGVVFSSIYEEQKENLDLFIFKNVAFHMYS